MTRRKSSRKSDQKGVEAIFSPSKEPKRAHLIFGGAVVSAGIFSMIISVTMVQFPHLWGRSSAAAYGSLEFASIGVFVLTCGAGLILSGLELPHAPSSGATIGDNASGTLPADRGVEDLSPSSYRLPSPTIRLALITFMQGVILLSLYSGLVEEYQSNGTMQAWVQAWVDGAQYLMNWGALLVSSFLMGILVVYSFVSRDLAK